MNAISKLFLASRPAFLMITLLGCFIGLALPSNSKESFAINFLAIALALSAHAGANLLNDYFDHLNGSDQNNEGRIPPFTGGSRYIQNNLLKPAQVFQCALILILFSAVIGIYICARTTWLLLPLGLIGALVVWSYSAPPLQLMSRGVLGELAIAIAWSLVVIGFASIQNNAIAYEAIAIGIAYGLIVANILLVNQIPDIEADRLAKKWTLASQKNQYELRRWYIAIFSVAYLLQIIAIIFLDVPRGSLLTLLLLPIFLYCAHEMINASEGKDQIRKLIVRNMAAAHLYSLFLILGMVFNKR